MSRQFRLVYPGAPSNETYSSEWGVYHQVDKLRHEWAAGGPIDTLTVQVDEGFGWQPYEHIDFKEEH